MFPESESSANRVAGYREAQDEYAKNGMKYIKPRLFDADASECGLWFCM
jgi:hypothetical protein